MTFPSGIAEVMRRYHDSKLLDTWTAMPGRIHLYNPATQRAEVELGIKRPIEDEENELQAEELPILPDVPICFAAATGFSVTFPIAKGDPVLVVFATLDPSEFLATGSPGNAAQIRTHSLGFGFAIPCGFLDTAPILEAVESAMVLKGSEVRLGANVLPATSVDKVTTETAVKDAIQAVVSAIAGAANGDAIPGIMASHVVNLDGSPSVTAEKP